MNKTPSQIKHQIKTQVSGMILAGGSSSRMQAIATDKAWLNWQGKPIIQHIIERFQPQVNALSINVNASPEAYQALGLPLWQDQSEPDWEKFPGPLAGILTGLRMCQKTSLASQIPQTPWLAVAPCDAPLLPIDMVEKLYQQATHTGAKIAIASTMDTEDKIKDHPVFSLIHTSMLESLYAYLQSGNRKIMLWMKQHSFERVVFEDARPFIINVNTPEMFNQLSQIDNTMTN